MRTSIVLLLLILFASTVSAIIIPCDSWQPLGSCGMDDSVNTVTVLDWEGNLTVDQYTTFYTNFTATDGSGTLNYTNASGANLNHTTGTGHVFGNGRYGRKTLVLNSSDTIVYRFDPLLTLTSDSPSFTVELIFSMDADTANFGDSSKYLFYTITGSGDTQQLFFMRALGLGANLPYMESNIIYNNSKNPISLVDYELTLTKKYIDGYQLHYLTATFDKLTNLSTFWVDGYKVGVDKFDGKFNATPTQIQLKPSWQDYTYHNVTFHEVRISNVARSESEIQSVWSKRIELNFTNSTNSVTYTKDLGTFGFPGIRVKNNNYNYMLSSGQTLGWTAGDSTGGEENGNRTTRFVNYSAVDDKVIINYELITNMSTGDGIHRMPVTEEYSINGKSLIMSISCAIFNTTDNCYRMSPYRTLSIEDYGYSALSAGFDYMQGDSAPYIVKINNSFFTSYLYDFSKGHSTIRNKGTKTFTSGYYDADYYVSYGKNTNNDYKKFNETLYITTSPIIENHFVYNLNNASIHRNDLSNKIILDLWEAGCPEYSNNDFLMCDYPYISRLYNYGMRDIVVNLQAWAGTQHPVEIPPASYYGGSTNFSKLINDTKALGFEFIPYIAYQDIYNNSEPFNTTEYIMLYQNTSGMGAFYHSSWGWSNASKYEKRKEIAQYNIPNISAFLVNGFFVDIESANTIFSFVDRDSTSLINASAWNARDYFVDYINYIKDYGYILSENSGDPLYTVGLIDGAAGDSTCCSNGYTQRLVPDYKLSQFHNKYYQYGGYYRRFFNAGNSIDYRNISQSDLDLYVVTNVGRANAPMLDSPVNWSHNISDEVLIKTYYMWKSVSADYMGANASSVSYWNGSAFIDLSTAMLRDYDFNNSMIKTVWSSGLTTWVNRNYSAFWPITGADSVVYNISPIGFYAENPSTNLKVYYNREYNSSHVKTFMSQSNDYIYAYSPNQSYPITFTIPWDRYYRSYFNTDAKEKQYVRFLADDEVTIDAGQTSLILEYTLPDNSGAGLPDANADGVVDPCEGGSQVIVTLIPFIGIILLMIGIGVGLAFFLNPNNSSVEFGMKEVGALAITLLCFAAFIIGLVIMANTGGMCYLG